MEKIPGSEFYAVRNVPIISTGIEYALSTGPATFTQEDLADAVKALGDPAIVAPRIKIGHQDPRFNGPEADGEPALGRVENLSIGDNGQTIYGDYVGVPAWLATIMATAYPSRSIEGTYNVDTVTGNKYKLVITAVSLLGISWPGVTTLDDLPVLLSAEGPPDVQVVNEEGGGMAIAATMNVEDIRRHYYEHLDAQGSEYSWWWIRAMQLDPNELIVDDDEGHLYRVPFEVSGNEVSFGDPKEVKVQYVNVPKKKTEAALAASAYVAGIADVRDLQVVYASRQESRPESEEGGNGLDAKQLRASLGLAEDATDEQVQQKIAELRASADSDPDDAEDADGGDDADSGADDGDDDSDPGVAEGESEGANDAEASGVVLDKETYEQLKAGAALADKHEKERIMSENGRILNDAIAAGKIPPARREHYEKLLAKDRDGTVAFLNDLAAGVVPVTEIGNGGDGDSSSDASGLPEGWFPEMKRNRVAAASRQRVTQAKEG